MFGGAEEMEEEVLDEEINQVCSFGIATVSTLNVGSIPA